MLCSIIIRKDKIQMCHHGFFSAGDKKNLNFFVLKLTKVWALLDANSSGFWTFIVQILQSLDQFPVLIMDHGAFLF